jgi:multidrug efflux pump subunit AcrA (membrane-fusion protein)
MNTKATLLLTLLLGTVLVTVCGKKDDAKPASVTPTSSANATAAVAAKAQAPRPVRFMQVGMRPLADITYLPGEVRPRFEQRYGFRVSGKIARRLVDVGQVVKAGQCLQCLIHKMCCRQSMRRRRRLKWQRPISNCSKAS